MARSGFDVELPPKNEIEPHRLGHEDHPERLFGNAADYFVDGAEGILLLAFDIVEANPGDGCPPPFFYARNLAKQLGASIAARTSFG